MTAEAPQPLEGVCCVHWETGYEGSPWAFQDERFIEPPTEEWPHERWAYEGLHILEDGDLLTIYTKDMSRLVLWEGTISLRGEGDFTGIQEGLHRQRWIYWFLHQYPASLVLGPKHQEEERE